jgi:hypothetical protein
MKRLLLLLMAATAVPVAAQPVQEVPAFDRPGLSFSVTTLPIGSVAWEQGLPDGSRDRREGVTISDYTAATNLRVGLSDRLELQVGHSFLNWRRQRGHGVRESEHGRGDTTLLLKRSLPVASPDWGWAVMGGATLFTGDAEFGNGHTRYALGSTLEWARGERSAIALYLNADWDHADTTWTLSPSYSLSLNERWSVFVEAGYSRSSLDGENYVAGGGVTWMMAPRLQLDMYSDFGLTSASTDVQAGFGFSVFFP